MNPEITLPPNQHSDKLTINQAAAIMGVSPQFLRLALQQEKFPFGVAVKMKRWVYFIHPEKFKEYMGQPTGTN